MLLRFTDNLIMQLTKDCNLHCKYCFQGDKLEWKDKEVSLEEFFQIIDTTIYERCVLGHIENLIDFHFHGGEVTMIDWPKLQAMILHIEKRKQYFPGITMCMQTNGINLTEDMCVFLRDHGVSVGTSFDGFDNDNRMSKEGTKKLMEKFKSFSENIDFKIGVLSVLSTDNMKTWFDDMKKISEYTNSPGVNIISTTIENDNLIPSPEDQWKYWLYPVLKSYLTDNPVKERDVKIGIAKILNDIIFESDNKEVVKTGCFDRICGHGANMISVDPNLNVYGCDKYLEKGDFINKRKGHHISDRDFLGLQEISDVVKFYKEIRQLEKKFGCDYCKANSICIGECQSYMISKYGECRLNAGMCEIFKRAYDFVSNNWVEFAKCGFSLYKDPLSIRPEALKELEKQNLKVVINSEENTFKVVSR